MVFRSVIARFNDNFSILVNQFNINQLSVLKLVPTKCTSIVERKLKMGISCPLNVTQQLKVISAKIKLKKNVSTSYMCTAAVIMNVCSRMKNQKPEKITFYKIIATMVIKPFNDCTLVLNLWSPIWGF